MSLNVELNTGDLRIGSYAEDTVLFEFNITHNLSKMAKKADLYPYLWDPNVLKAEELIKPLKKGLDKLIKNPKYYKLFNPKNGWGKYEGLVEFVQNYLVACQKYPFAYVRVDK